MKKYIVYKIINLINDKIYIGVHKTSDINDDYMGSGWLIKKAIKKYGIENFKKEIIQVFNNPEDMFVMESKLVNEDFVKSKDTYNIKEGGKGGFDYKAVIEGSRKSRIEHPERWIYTTKLASERFKEMHRKGLIKYDTFTNRKHTEETKKKIGIKNSMIQRGKGNSQYGTCWIYKLELQTNKKIKKEDFSIYENEGWVKGRKMSF